MGVLKAQVELGHVSGLARDKVVNTFTIVAPEVGAGLVDAAVDHDDEIINFYNSLGAGQAGYLANWIGTQISRAANACGIKFYDITDKLTGAPAGSPIHEILFTLEAAGGQSNLPSELAAVLTIEGTQWSDQPVNVPLPPDGPTGDAHPQARRRGRVFLGPLRNGAITDTSGAPSLHPDLLSSMRAAGNVLADSIKARGAGNFWAVWSRTNAQVYEVESVSSDAAVDVQRRRGERSPSVRARLAV